MTDADKDRYFTLRIRQRMFSRFIRDQEVRLSKEMLALEFEMNEKFGALKEENKKLKEQMEQLKAEVFELTCLRKGI